MYRSPDPRHLRGRPPPRPITEPLEECLGHMQKVQDDCRKLEREAYIMLAFFLLSAACHITVIVCRLLGIE